MLKLHATWWQTEDLTGIRTLLAGVSIIKGNTVLIKDGNTNCFTFKAEVLSCKLLLFALYYMK